MVGLTSVFKLKQVEFFEPFWDSGEPRVGEKGARGWRAWMHQQERGGWVLVNPGECFQEVRGMRTLLGLGAPVESAYLRWLKSTVQASECQQDLTRAHGLLEPPTPISACGIGSI